MRRITIIVLILFSTLNLFAQKDWVDITSEKSNIKFKLPAQPIIEKKKLGDIYIEVFSYKDALNVFGVVASDFSKTGLDFTYSDPSEYYQEMKEGSLVTGDALLLSEQAVAYKKMLGKEIVYTQLVGKHEYTYFKRFFFRGSHIYQVAIGGPSRMKQILLDKKRIFFNTIEFQDK